MSTEIHYNWPKQLTENLIVLYQECINLYDTSDPAYNDNEIRTATLDEILTELKKFDSNLTIDNISDKIRYFHEIASGKKTDSEDSWLIHELQFLEEYVDRIDFTIDDDNTVNETEAASSNIVFCDVKEPETITPVRVTKKRKYADTPRPSTVVKLKTLSPSSAPIIQQSPASSSSSYAAPATVQQPKHIDDNEVWTKFVLTEFKRFKNLDNLEDTKWKMLNILKENLMKDRIENKFSTAPSGSSTITSATAVKRQNEDHFDKYDHDYY